MLKYILKDKEGNRDIDLPTLIDLVFLLLIFFIVNFAVSVSSGLSSPQPESKLPRISGNAAAMDSRLNALTLKIERTESGLKVLRVLDPALDRSEEEALERIDRELAKDSPDSSHIAVFNRNFLQLSGPEVENLRAFRLIKESISNYRRAFLQSDGLENTVEIVADEDTEFKIIDYIFKQCQDDPEEDPVKRMRNVPKVTFRVSAPTTESAEGTSS